MGGQYDTESHRAEFASTSKSMFSKKTIKAAGALNPAVMPHLKIPYLLSLPFSQGQYDSPMAL